LIVHTFPLPSRHLYARPDQTAELRERGVVLSVERDALQELRTPSAAKRTAGETAEHPLQAFLRKAWDWLTGVR